MSDLSLVTTNFFATASETFTDNLSGSISAGAVTVPVNSGVEYATGEVVVLTVDPGTALEATFIGEKDTTNQFINCIWTEGNTAVGHDAGATIIDYDSATHFNAAMKGIQQFADQDGNLLTQAVRDALGLGATDVNGWEVLPYTLAVSSGYSQGNRIYNLTVANNDLTDELSFGQKLRFARGTTAPTQCFDAEASSSQYASRVSGSVTGTISTMTDDFSAEAWIKPESLTAGAVVGRHDGTSGWFMEVQADLTVRIVGDVGATIDSASTDTSLLPGQWAHIAGTLDLSANSLLIYINGVSVGVTTGFAAAAIVQAGPLQIGARNSGTFFDGKISDVRVWNVVRTQLQIRDNMNQQLVGTETNLVGYWKLNGDFNDSTTAANHLTGSGGAVATNVDNPMKSTMYALIKSVTYSAPNTTIQVQVDSNNCIPNMTLSAAYYSSQDTPYGFPSLYREPTINTMNIQGSNVTLATNVTYYDSVSMSFTSEMLPGDGWYKLTTQAQMPFSGNGIAAAGDFTARTLVNGVQNGSVSVYAAASTYTLQSGHDAQSFVPANTALTVKTQGQRTAIGAAALMMSTCTLQVILEKLTTWDTPAYYMY